VNFKPSNEKRHLAGVDEGLADVTPQRIVLKQMRRWLLSWGSN
jgi:hypothetical protein